MKKRTVLGYRRENGRVGVRNHVIILPVDDISNAACEAVANNIKGTLALPHAFGRLQFGEDLELHFRTMIGTGSNPNVAAVVVIGIESGWTQRIVDGIAKTGKPVKGFWIEGKGDIQTIAEASRQAKEYVQWASELQRTECGLEELYISVKCGESDTTTGLSSCPTVGNVIDKHCAVGGTASFGETSELTGAEHIVASKAANDEVRKEFFEAFEDYTKLVFDQKTNDLSESQPTKGNIAGGLTTIEEKALGNVEKLGKKTKFVGCLKPAAAPDKAGPMVHGYVQCCRGSRHTLGGLRRCRSPLPHRPGQRDRQSHRARHQTQRQSQRPSSICLSTSISTCRRFCRAR